MKDVVVITGGGSGIGFAIASLADLRNGYLERAFHESGRLFCVAEKSPAFITYILHSLVLRFYLGLITYKSGGSLYE